MKQKFRVTWQHSQHDAPLVIVCDNFSQFLGSLNALIELGVLDVDNTVIND